MLSKLENNLAYAVGTLLFWRIVAAVISGELRTHVIALDTRYGSSASASRFMWYSSLPLPVI